VHAKQRSCPADHAWLHAQQSTRFDNGLGDIELSFSQTPKAKHTQASLV
jgi:hypothetical protein